MLTKCLSVGSPAYTRDHAQFHFQVHQSGKLPLGCGRGKGEARSVTLEDVPRGNISPGNGITSLQVVGLAGTPRCHLYDQLQNNLTSLVILLDILS